VSKGPDGGSFLSQKVVAFAGRIRGRISRRRKKSTLSAIWLIGIPGRKVDSLPRAFSEERVIGGLLELLLAGASQALPPGNDAIDPAERPDNQTQH